MILPLIAVAAFILLAIGFFSPKTSLFWYKKERTKKASAIIYLIAWVGLSLVSASVNGDPEPKAAIPPKADKKMVEVLSFSGNGMKKSKVFSLSGSASKIEYKYDNVHRTGIGMFAVYVVDKGVEIMKDGGIPEIMTTKENEESESYIQKPAGEHYLEVNASGNWTVTIFEEN